MSFLIFGGKTGWIGKKMVNLLREQNEEVIIAESRLQYLRDLENELDKVKPKYVINCAGLTGRPNVDWCEDHKVETIRTNVMGTLALADACLQRGIHLTNFATGCIYHYDDAKPEGSGKGFTEEDKPNFDGSFYSKSKIVVEELLKNYDNVLTLRLRMPISDDLSPRNFVTKITKYRKVVNIPNSMTVLYDLLPIAADMSKKEVRGIINFTNPGVISHNEVLQLFKKHVCPTFTWENFSIEEHNTVVKAKRSNNELDTTKLSKLYPDIPNIKESMEQVMIRMRQNIGEQENPAKI